MIFGYHLFIVEPTKQIIDDLYREKVERARRMTPWEKLMAGPALFDSACAWTKAGIRMQHPQADERRVQELLIERIESQRRQEQAT